MNSKKPSGRNMVLALLIPICLAVSGCTGTIRIREGFHSPVLSPPSAKLPVKITAVVDKDIKATNFKAGFPWCCMGIVNAVVYTEPGFTNALTSQLSNLFDDVRIVETRDAGRDADYLVLISTSFPQTLGLTFLDPMSGTVVAKYQHACVDTNALYDQSTPVLNFLGRGVFMCAVFPIGLSVGGMMRSSHFAYHAYAVEQSISAALREISKQILADELVTQTPPAKKRREALEARGDAAAASGDYKEALGAYTGLIRDSVYNGRSYKRVREKGLKLVGANGIDVSVTQDAVRHMTKGRFLVKEADDKAKYAEAIAEMEQAVRSAPWWPTGYYNLGLTQASAEQYEAAAENLNMYLLAAPDADDAAEVRRKTYELEAKRDRAVKKD